MNQELQTTHQSNQVVAHPASGGIGVTGLESIPVSMMGMPYIKIVQPTSQNVELADGADAPAGHFYFSDLQVSKPEITISLITAKKMTREFERDGETKMVDQVGMLFRERESGKNYLMSLSVMSFQAFGKLMSLVTSEEWQTAWDKAITISTEKQENSKGKYYTVRFQVGDKLSEAQAEEVNADWMTLGGYFERDDEVNEDVDPNSVPV